MAISIIPTDNFVKELKRLSKKHQRIIADIAELSAQLKENPNMVQTLVRTSIK